jgi:uncharacterized protein (TIGR03437 family)
MTRLVLTIAAVALFCSITQVQATPITYTLTTTASGTLGASSFTNASVTLTLQGDTSGVAPSANGYLFNSVSAMVNISGVGTATLTDSIVLGSTFDTLFDGSYGVLAEDTATQTGILLQQGAVFHGYKLGPFGPVKGTGGVASGSKMTPIFPTTAGNLTWAVGQPLGTSTFTAAVLPAITAVENAASNIALGLPNAGIAQGAIFVIYGGDLGPASISFASAAFQSTSLSNTSVTVKMGTTTVDALMYYTSASQVAALLPSNTPTGTGTITVTYNGQTSGQAPITVVANNLGIFSIDSSGGGSGIVTYADYSLVSPVKAANCGGPNTTCGAANPGDALILWATGLGPVNGSDAAGAGLGVNMPDIPLKLWLGGVQATVAYQGRSGCCIGEDQIVFTVPDKVPTGCAVPLLVQIGDEISNNTLIPVANGSRTCPLTTALASLGSEKIEQLIAAGPIQYGSVKLDHFSDGGGTYEDDARFQFLHIVSFVPGTQSFVVSSLDNPPPGTCIAFNNLNAGFNNLVSGGNLLDAGSSFTVMGPNGNLMLPVNSQKLTAFNMTGAFLVPGPYTVTGNSGADVGPFNANIAIPAASTLVSPVNNGTATRANGMRVTWTGGSDNLQIQVNSCSDNTCANGASAICIVPASLGTFTIPPYILEALPAGNSAGVVLSSYSDATFTAMGLDAGTIGTYSNTSGFGYGWGSGGFTLK